MVRLSSLPRPARVLVLRKYVVCVAESERDGTYNRGYLGVYLSFALRRSLWCSFNHCGVHAQPTLPAHRPCVAATATFLCQSSQSRSRHVMLSVASSAPVPVCASSFLSHLSFVMAVIISLYQKLSCIFSYKFLIIHSIS